MNDGAKKAGGVLAAMLVGIGTFAARNLDDCARVGAGAGRFGDDAVVAGAGGLDDLGRLGAGGVDDLGRLGSRADDLAPLGATYGDDALRSAPVEGPVPVYGEGRTGGSFGGGSFADDVAPMADDFAGAGLGDDGIERLADLAIDVSAEAVEAVLDDDPPPVFVPELRGLVPERARVVALSAREERCADVSVGSMPALDAALRAIEPDALAVVVLPSRRSPLRDGRSEAAVLARAAQLGRRAIVLSCEPGPGTDARCVERAAATACIAAAEGPRGIAERIETLRDATPASAPYAIHRLQQRPGDARPHLATRPAP